VTSKIAKPARSRDGEPIRPDLVELGRGTLGKTELLQLRVIRRSFERGRIDSALRWCQRRIGARWIDLATKNLRQVHGLDRLPPLDPDKSYLCVCNHRSFFDLYMVTTVLVLEGMPHRMLFPVRSNFFYDRPLGFLVNGAMSFFAMYPPVFRERQRVMLNLAGIDEVVWMLRRGGAFVGMHPEGTRKKDSDSYSLLPAQSGVGKIIRHAKATVIPAFVNGLEQSDLVRQVTGNATGTGTPIIVVFGKPIDFGKLLDDNPSPRLYKQIADRTVEAISALGQEERAIRAAL
jgi:1-acyl-sn-glycerol-3-phosphate acyltransferase